MQRNRRFASATKEKLNTARVWLTVDRKRRPGGNGRTQNATAGAAQVYLDLDLTAPAARPAVQATDAVGVAEPAGSPDDAVAESAEAQAASRVSHIRVGVAAVSVVTCVAAL